jgi:hypothetical protein
MLIFVERGKPEDLEKNWPSCKNTSTHMKYKESVGVERKKESEKEQRILYFHT